MEDACDQALIREPFFHSAPLKHVEVGGGQADVDARILPHVAPGRLDGGLLRAFLVLHGSEFAALVCGDQPLLLVIMKSALLHSGSPFLRFLVALRLGWIVLRNIVRPSLTTGTTCT